MRKLKVYTDKKFKNLTTFHIGGKIKYYIEVKNRDEVCEAITFAKENRLPIFVLGGGSDILVGDGDFDGIVIKYVGKNLEFKRRGSSFLVTAEAGLEWDELVRKAVERNLQGIECMSGIPGTVGAAPIQNIGAYGQELKDVFVSLMAYDIKKEKFANFNKSDCLFNYRESFFKRKESWQRYIITDVTLELVGDGKAQVKYESLKSYLELQGIKNVDLLKIRQAVLAVRSKIFYDPELIGNAGSFFKSPVVGKSKLEELKRLYPDIKFYELNGEYKLPAGWLIERVGWKGRKHKGAAVSPLHALILINSKGKARASDVVELAERIADDVYKKFGVRLEHEVQIINYE